MERTRPIGITAGTGIYEMPEMETVEEIEVDTPFGRPSDAFIRGNLLGVEVVFLSRHGRGHLIPAPSVNYRANIYGFKALGVDALLSVGAVGSLKEELRPTDIVIPDQFYDNTKARESSFFEGSPAVHINFADPVCPVLSRHLFESGRDYGARVHLGATYICIQGPAFSTRAESEVYRGWGADIIGMTSATEAKLAREAEICYASMSLITDYDVWKDREADVTVEVIIENMKKTADMAKEIVKRAVVGFPGQRDCVCRSALADAVVSDLGMLSEENRSRLGILLERYYPREG